MKQGKATIYIISLLTVTFLAACNVIAYKGPALSKEEITENKDSKNFHARQANEMIDHNLKKKDKRNRVAQRQRKKEQDYLESLNKPAKSKRIIKPVPADFY